MKRRIIAAIAALTLLAGCSGNSNEQAQARLTEAVGLIASAATAESQAAAYEALSRADALISEIRSDFSSSDAALRIAGGETIGTVALAQLPAMLAEASRGRTLEQCQDAPDAACLYAVMMQEAALLNDADIAEMEAQLPAPMRIYFALVIGGPDAAARLAGEPHGLTQNEVLEVLSQLIVEGRVETLRAWLAAPPHSTGEPHPDMQTLAAFANDMIFGRPLVLDQITLDAIAALAESDSPAVERLVLVRGGVAALEAALRADPLATLARWRETDAVSAGSDTEALLAVALWNLGFEDEARAIFATGAPAGNDMVMANLRSFAGPEARAGLLDAALNAVDDPLMRARVAMGLLSLADDAVAEPAIAAIAEDAALGEHLRQFGASTGRELGSAGNTALYQRLLALPETHVPTGARESLAVGWAVGQAVAGDTSGVSSLLRQHPQDQHPIILNDLMWALLNAGEAQRATALYDELGLSRMALDRSGRVIQISLLAGDFANAARLLSVNDAFVNVPERALRLRLAHDSGHTDAEVQAVLAALEAHTWQDAARTFLSLSDPNREAAAGFAARYALSLSGEPRIGALQGVLRRWPSL